MIMDHSGTLLVCGLPESGRLRVQRREGVKTTLADVYGAPELLYATPAPPDGERGPLSAALPHLCMPDGVAFREKPPPPPRFFTTSLPGGGGGDGAGCDLHLACCLFFEEIPAAQMLPLLHNAINSQPPSSVPSSPTRAFAHSPVHTPPSHSSRQPPDSPSLSSSAGRRVDFSSATASSATTAAASGSGSPELSARAAAYPTAHGAQPPAASAGVSSSSESAGHELRSERCSSEEPSAEAAPAAKPNVSYGNLPASATSRARLQRREDAMKLLRARGLPLGVCAVALHQSGDDVPRALEWLTHGRGLQLLRAYEAARSPGNSTGTAAAAAGSDGASPPDGMPPPSPLPSPPPSPPPPPPPLRTPAPNEPTRCGPSSLSPSSASSPSWRNASAGTDASRGGGGSGDGPASPSSRLWALKAVAVLTTWPMHAFWREYLHALLCAFPPNAAVPIDRRIMQATIFSSNGSDGGGGVSGSLPPSIARVTGGGLGSGRITSSSTLLPRHGGLPPEDISAILSKGGPTTIEATRLVAAGTLWARLPRTLLVCTTPSANIAATLAASMQPLQTRAGSGAPGQMTPRLPSETGESAAPPPSRLLHAQHEHNLASLSAAVCTLPASTLCTILSALAAEWSVLLFARDPALLSAVCNALLLALRPLEWQGACLPLIPRTHGGATMLQKLRAASRHVPLLLGLLQSPHAPHHPPSTPQARRTLHVLLPHGQPLWHPSERLPMLPPSIARNIEATILTCTAEARSRSGARSRPIHALGDSARSELLDSDS